MAERKNTTRSSESETKPAEAKSSDGGDAEVQAKVDRETEQGFRGVEVDPTDNFNYTLAGQNAGAATPETDEKAAKAAAEAQDDVAARATGVAER